MNISLFENVKKTKPIENLDFEQYLNNIKFGKWENLVLDYRTGKMDKIYLPAVAPAGVFSNRNYKGLIEHSGIINIDIDSKDNPEINLIEARAELYSDPYIYGGHISVGGKGLSLYIKINPKKHLESYFAIEKHLANKYHIVIDKSAKDIPRLRFVSHDPDLHFNPKSKKWTSYIEKKKQEPKNYNTYIVNDSDFAFVMNQITQNRINIAEDYQEWLTLGFAFANEFGENGRGYFHDVSQISAKYNKEKTDKKYTSLLRSKGRGFTIKSFYWMAKNAGCNIKSERTIKIEKIAKTRMKQVGKNGGFKNKIEAKKNTQKYLQEFENIKGEDVSHIIDQISDMSDYELNKEKNSSSENADIIIQVLNDKGVIYNLITGKLEIKGKALNDNDINSIYLDILIIDEKIKRPIFDTVINSNRVKKINPFKDFIEKHKNLKPKGNIDKLLESINDNMKIDNEYITDYKDVYVRKWLLSLMASIHGTYSLMILVLTGKQMTDKTNWFRNLLPKELSKYYAESKLDAGKDDEILMTQKLIIVDDEFGGKSKQEAKKLKDLSSKQYFSIRRPYGKFPEDIQRIAVLGGTSNEEEILNDPTGNRRIIPLNIINIDREIYDSIDKTELFMEIYHEWKECGENWMLTPDEVKWLNKSTSSNEQSVLEADLIKKFFELDNSYSFNFTSTDVMIKMEPFTKQKLNLYKVGQNLKKLGYTKKSKKINGKVAQVWNIREVTDVIDSNTYF